MAEEGLTLLDIENEIAAVINPLKAQLKRVESRERLILSDLEETREMKSKLISTLRKLDPDMPRPGKKAAAKKQNGNGRGVPLDAVLAVVRDAVDKVAPNNPDGFTRARIGEQLRADGVPMGDQRQKEAMEELHSSGYLTLHKLVTGGNKSYKRTEDLNP